MGYGPAILGYADPRVDEAAREGHGSRRRVRAVDGARTQGRRAHLQDGAGGRAGALLQFRHRGGDGALRLARAYTGKDDYVILEGGYHGLFDAAMWYTPMDKWSQVGDPEVKPYSEGVPLSTRSFAHFVQANDANQLEDVFKRHAGSIACLLIEPIMGNCLGIAADPSICARRASCATKYGVVLLIDEVKTGFRVARGGVQELYGVKADLCTFAKAVATAIRSRCSRGARTSCARSAGRGARRHLHGALGVAGRGREDAADPRRDRCAGAHRRLWHATAPA
jgi:glutamate-1-semialdehyde 2,1-aminomutase